MTKKRDNLKIKKAEENLSAVEGALTRTEMWLEKNSKLLIIIVAALVIVVLGFFGYKKFIQEPKAERAQSEMFVAEKYFGSSDYEKALNGDGNHAGFLEIYDNYKSTKPGKLAAYYAGICYLNQKQYDEAITYLKKFNLNDEFLAAFAEGAIGDAYMELGDTKTAIKQYEKAAEMRHNEVITPTFLFKAATCYELEGNNQTAVTVYEKIRKEFPNSNEARETEKCIARAKAKMSK